MPHVFKAFRERKAGRQTPPPAEQNGAAADADLARRVQVGDLDAFEQLFRRHQRRLYSIAMGILHDPDDAEDATQEAFVNAYRALPRLAECEAFRAWLTRIVVNVCRDRARRFDAKPDFSLDAEDEETGTSLQIPDPGPQPDQVLAASELQQQVRRAIAGLPPDFREVVVLHEVHGLKLEEVAQSVGVPIGTVKSRLSRGRALLKRSLAAYVHGVDLPAASQGGH
ncbi:MAG: sigma-70 family RNA polymerase sigma factor [Armatimonadetes bacterium]|nr:sigma-70 family RNA polymerase sigma factor [Armatimonadota bacterium]